MSAGERTAIDLDPAGVAERLAQDSGVQLLDVREAYEHEAGHIAGSRHIALASLPAEAATLKHGRPVIAYCRVGARSDMAAQALRAAGFEAYSMSGGLMRWADEGRALVPEPDGHVADH